MRSIRPSSCHGESGGARPHAQAVHYFETTSDAFFANETNFLEQRGIDVALIDGLHTYQQVVRDVTNTLRYLRDDGVIVLHDCNPTRPSVAFPAASYADFRARNRWWHTMRSGDVWKAIADLRSTRHDLRIAVLDCDYGLGITRTGVPDSVLTYSADQIAALNYSDLSLDRERLLNLKPWAYFDQFLVGESRSGPTC